MRSVPSGWPAAPVASVISLSIITGKADFCRFPLSLSEASDRSFSTVQAVLGLSIRALSKGGQTVLLFHHNQISPLQLFQLGQIFTGHG